MPSFDISELNDSINEMIQKIKDYAARLNNTEKYGWLLIGVGVLLVMIALLLW